MAYYSDPYTGIIYRYTIDYGYLMHLDKITNIVHIAIITESDELGLVARMMPSKALLVQTKRSSVLFDDNIIKFNKYTMPYFEYTTLKELIDKYLL